jgi:hypothetical protein
LALALVDDTGDPGTGGAGRPWFCWIALVVRDELVDGLRELRSDASVHLRDQGGPPDSMQWDGTIQGDNLVGVLRRLRGMDDWVWVAVASYTPLSTPETARQIYVPTDQRYYTLLCLLERVSWIGETWGEGVTATVEAPNDRDFIQAELRRRHIGGLPHSRARYSFLPADGILVVTPEEEPLLNLAHCLALAFGKAVNPHGRWGETFPEYLEIVRDNLWVGPAKDGTNGLTGVGITVLPYDESYKVQEGLPFIRRWWVEHFAALLGRD